MKSTLFLTLVSASLLALPGCGGASKEKVSLAYAGDDARNTTDALSAAITDAGMSPNCRDRRFCKFKFNDQGTVHYKLTKRDPTLVLEISGDVLDEERPKLERDMTDLAQEIWKKASGVTLEKEEHQKAEKAARKEKEDALAAERHKVDTEARLEMERIAAEERAANKVKAEQDQKDAEEAMQVTDTMGAEPKTNGGAALKVETPDGAVCNVTGDQTGKTKSLEVPFQIETMPGVYYTVDCALPKGGAWRKKVQTKDRFVTVIKLKQGK